MTKKKYRIVPKRDFGSGPGYWMPGAGSIGTENYGYVKHGFIVTDSLCNIMPAATWFRSVADAMTGLRVYLEASGDANVFWHRIRRAIAQARKEEAVIRALLEHWVSEHDPVLVRNARTGEILGLTIAGCGIGIRPPILSVKVLS